MLGFYRTYTTPFKEQIPAFVDDFFSKVPLWKRFLRFFGRYLYVETALRKSKKVSQLTEKHKRILWIQWVDSYLGDSLMDLSSRVLFTNKKIDLLTKKYTANIYRDDIVFKNVFTDASQCNPSDYDLLIIDSYRQRSIKSFIGQLSSIPHVSLFGYYNVNDFNRLYFSFYRINQLLSHPYDERYIKDIAKPLLPITASDKSIVNKLNLPDRFIAIAIGGVWKERTFHHWDNVVDEIISRDVAKNVVLVGTKESEKEALSIYEQHPKQVMSLVGTLSFNQTAKVISQSELLICADGGLLHAANAFLTPVVCLFHEINPSTRLITSNKSVGLIEKVNIDNIKAEEIVDKVKQLKK